MEEIKQMFAYYGFLQCPLYDNEIQEYISLNLTNDEIYAIGCDLCNGYDN